MQQYLITVPETQHAKNLLDYIIQTGYFKEVKQLSDIEIEKADLKKDLADAINEMNLMKEGKLEKQSLKDFLNEL